MGNKRKSNDDKSKRTLRFLSILMSARTPLAYSVFMDESRWGSDRNMKRFMTDINADWESVMGAPLFEKVKVDGRVHIVLADEAFAKLPERRVAVMSATMEFMKTLRGSIIDDELKPIKDGFTARLSVSERKKLERIQSKFFYVGKGQKNYGHSPLKEIIDEVYTAITKECELQVTVNRDDGPEDRHLQPLSMVLFNSSLYLIASRSDDKPGARPRTYRLEAFSDAKAILKSKIAQKPFNPTDFYEDYFGLSTGDGSEKVSKIVLEFGNNMALQRYMRERRWSSHDKFEDIPGGKLRLTMKLKITPELDSWILGMGPHVKVIEPVALHAEIAKAAKAMAKLY